MYDHNEKTNFHRKMEAPAEISILETNREVVSEAVRVNTVEARKKLSEVVRNRLYEKIRQAFGIDMATESPIDIYPVFTPEPFDPSAVRMDFVVAPRWMDDIHLEVKAEKNQRLADQKEGQTMELNELIKALENMLPKKALYSDVIGAEVAYARCRAFVYEDPESRLIKQAIAELNKFSEIRDILGPSFDTNRLREIARADQEGRCFVFLVPPDRNTNKSEVVICDDGEAYLQTVYEVDVGRNSAGEMNCVYLTKGGADFETADIGKTVFLPCETNKIEDALAKMKEDAHG